MNEQYQAKEFEASVFREISEVELYAPLKVQINRSYLSLQKELDAEIQIEWQNKIIKFNAEIASRTSPQLLELKAYKIRKTNKSKNLMLIVPYLSKSVVEILQLNEISGLDLNGNFYISTKELVAIRLDKKNEYTESNTIKKIYSGNSSIVCRYLLTSKNFKRGISEIYEEIIKRNTEISISTISKVVKRLEEELIVSRSDDQIKVIQKEKLLGKLTNEYSEPKILQETRLKAPKQALQFLKDLSFETDTKWTLSGNSSGVKYAAATAPQPLEVYIEEIPRKWLSLEDDRFPNLILKKTKSDFVYFDRQIEDGIWFASRLQTFIELARGDKRQKETSEYMIQDLLK